MILDDVGVRTGDLGLARVRHASLIRRIFFDHGCGIRLVPLNHAYPEQRLQPDTPVRIWKVIAHLNMAVSRYPPEERKGT